MSLPKSLNSICIVFQARGLQKLDALLLIATPSLLVLAGIIVWWPSPYYPDELAFRIGTARFIQDGLVRWGLYPFCTNSPQDIPWIFVPAAWLLSALDIYFFPYQHRLFSSGVVIFTCFVVTLIAISKKNIWPIALLSLITIGVSGSGLVLVRGEHVLVFAICICLLATYLGKNIHKTIHILIFFVLVLVVTTGVFIHPQGILFTPLIGCVASHVISLKFRLKKITILVWICVVLLFIYGFIYHRFTCENYPRLAEYFNSMVFSFDKNYFSNLLEFSKNKITKYIEVFLYSKQYQVLYIPGIEPSFWFSALNNLIFSGVLGSLIINMVLTSRHSYIIIKSLFNRKINKTEATIGIPLTLSIAASFLLFYDANQYFYRTFFLHFLIIISNVLYLTRYKISNTRFIYPLLLGCIGISMLSTLVNYKHFFYRLPSWDAIATTPKDAVLHPKYNDIQAAAKACGVDISRGNLVIDAYTYEAVKHTKLLVDVYYARLMADVGGRSVSQVTQGLKIDKVLASCKGMKDSNVGWPPDVTQHTICCSTLR